MCILAIGLTALGTFLSTLFVGGQAMAYWGLADMEAVEAWTEGLR